MAKARSGWFGERIRHSNARKYGKAQRYGRNPNAINLKKASIPDSQFDPKQLAIGMKVESEHSNNPAVQKAITKAHLSEDKMYYSKLRQVESKSYQPLKKEPFKPIIPIKDKASLPVQFSITIPSTQNTDKSIGQKGLNKRVKETNKFIVDRFYGDTSIKGKGDYESNGKLIAEDVVVIEVSTTPESFNKHKKEVANYIKDKRKEWGQKQMAYTTEGDLFLYPQDPEKTPIR